MNHVVLVGRLTKDPELKYTPGANATAVATFSLAVNRTFKNKDGNYEADFINIVVWGKTAENVANNLHKGNQAALEGRIQTRTYEGNDGQKKYVTEVVASEVQFLDPKNKPANNGYTPPENDGFDPTQGEDDVPF
jgi:single-strand DNA-binding protein